MRYIINAHEIKSWVRERTNRVDTPIAKQWLKSQLFKYIINDFEAPNFVQQIMKPSENIPDWIIQKLQSGFPVYRATFENIDLDLYIILESQIHKVGDWINMWTHKHPNSRINYTWKQAITASKEWHDELAQNVKDEDESFDDEGLIIFHEYDDGYRWVDIQSEVCLEREGARMGHCVGSYYQKVSEEDVKILSLRDPKNKPHVTVELCDFEGDWFIEQIEGKQNTPPISKYRPYIKDLLISNDFKTTENGMHSIENIGLCYDYDTGKTVDYKDVADLIMKTVNGYKWVKKNDEEDHITRVRLMNGEWTSIHLLYVFPNQINSTSDLFPFDESILQKDWNDVETVGKLHWVQVSRSNPHKLSIVRGIKDLLNNYNFHITDVANNDLKQIGLFRHKGKFVNIAEISQLVLKTKNNYKWISLNDMESCDSMEIRLVDENFDTYIKIGIDSNSNAKSLLYYESFDGDTFHFKTMYRDHLLDIVKKPDKKFNIIKGSNVADVLLEFHIHEV